MPTRAAMSAIAAADAGKKRSLADRTGRGEGPPPPPPPSYTPSAGVPGVGSSAGGGWSCSDSAREKDGVPPGMLGMPGMPGMGQVRDRPCFVCLVFVVLVLFFMFVAINTV